MPRKASKPTIAAEHFNWRLFKRNDIYYADGRCNQPSVGKHSLNTHDEQEARARLRDLDHHIAVQHGKTAPKSTAASVQIDDGWRRFMEYSQRPQMLGGVTESTAKRYRAVRDKHMDFCHSRRITLWHQIDKKSIEAYGAWLTTKGYAPATLYLELNLLSQILKWMVTVEKLLPETSLVVLNLRRSEESDAYCYTSDEVWAMIEYCRNDPGLHWLADIILTLATTGMRIGELVGLRWTDVDLSHNIITLPDNRYSGRGKMLGKTRTNKGRQTRRVPIHASLQEALARMVRRADGRVFSGPRGGCAKPDTIRTILVRDVIGALKERFPTPPNAIGFEHGRLHSLRHSFVSQAFLSGVSEGEIRTWVGHKDSRIVARYHHLGDEDSRRKMNQIEFFNGAGAPPDVPATKPSQNKHGGAQNEQDNENDAA